MQEMINRILENYIFAKEEAFKEHSEAIYIRNCSAQIIGGKTHIDLSRYKIEGSPGKGNWADVPWLGIFDREITLTATKGYDIVYLFCSDMSGVYISLNQGWTYFKDKYGTKEGKRKIQLVANAWKSILSSTLTDFSFDPIDLKGNHKSTDLSVGYELGHICGKFYEKGNIPSDEVLINDLRNLLGVYRELKGHLVKSSEDIIETTNNYLIVNQSIGLFERNNKEETNIDNLIENIQNSILLIEAAPTNISNSNDSSDFTPRKVNFVSKVKNQKKLGLAGELMVLKFEKDKLLSHGRDDLAKLVKHVSEECGDGAGYDILSFELNGDKKFIEVKTTSGSKDTPFILTSNELKFSELNSENYYLYRVFDFNREQNAGKMYTLKGDISKLLQLKAQQYVVEGINLESSN